MVRILMAMAMLVMTVVFSGTCVWAADQERDREQLTEQDQERLRDQDIYGWELMSREERQEHRRMMRSLNTREERSTPGIIYFNVFILLILRCE